jgi:2-oxoglutarate ferredoxin oxidoreductase subunit alpha
MARVDVTVEVCGMSGDGTIAAGGLLNAAISDAGFSVLGFDSYPAEIRGFGRCVTRSRIGDQEIVALEDRVDALISLDDLQSQSRIRFLSEDAAVFFESNPPAYVEEEDSLAARLEPGVHLYGMPLADLASGASGSSRGRNLTALGGFAAVYGVSPEAFRTVIRKKFESKGQRVVDANVSSFDAGYEYAMGSFSDRMRGVLSAASGGEGPERVMLSGNVAAAKAALDAGLKLYFGYPITPATPIMEYLASELPRAGGSVVQMEDEISSIAAVLGGFHAGARSMTATSGPGFALMTELITHGVMTETPAVIVNVQRGGPSTGLPTKTEQSDLHAAVFGGPGDSLRIVVAPSNVVECYHHTVKSFQWAEKYQTPVIVLTDFYLGNRIENLPMPQASEADVADWNRYPEGSERDGYRRFEVTESGISPRSIPGMKGLEFSTTGLEHVESGTPDYSPEIHTLMGEKRLRKIRGALSDLPPPWEYSAGGKLKVGVIGWGSTFGSILESVTLGRDRGYEVGALKIISLFPYHEAEIREFMNRCDDVLIPELNLQGQLANLIGHLHSKDVVRMDRATGVPMPPSAILKEIERLLEAGTA